MAPPSAPAVTAADHRQGAEDPPVDQGPPGRLRDPGSRRPDRRVVGGPGQPRRRPDARLGRRHQVMGRRRDLSPCLEHPTHRPLDNSPVLVPPPSWPPAPEPAR